MLGERADGAGKRPRNGAEGRRATETVFRELSAHVEACFDAVTVADVCTRAEQLGLLRPGAQRYVYTI